MSKIMRAATGGRRVLAAVVGLAFSAGSAMAQLVPDRTYYGVNRPMPMTVQAPADAEGPLKVLIFTPGSAEPMADFSVAPGPIDFAALFGRVWGDGVDKMVYAQLAAGDRRIGPAVVIQPMLDPATAIPGGGGNVQFRPGEGRSSGMRVYVDQHILLDTTGGEMEIRLRPDVAPNTAWTIRELVRGGFYTDILFHRIVAKLKNGHRFVLQVGDPTGTGSGGPGFVMDMEKSTLAHDYGVVSMARAQDPNSAGSQFFICLSRQGTEFLDGRYTTFGEIVRGAEAVEAIAATPTGPDDRPEDEANGPKIRSARLVDAPPYGTAPARISLPSQAPAEGGR